MLQRINILKSLKRCKMDHFINFVTLAYIITDSLRMMCKHGNMYECFKKQTLLINIVHFLDKYNRTVL